MNETKTRPNTDYIDNNRAQSLLEKWSPVLDYTSDKVSAIDDASTRLNTAILLENQEEWCIKEANNGNVAGTNSGAFGSTLHAGAQSDAYQTDDSYAKGDARLPKILIPMIRRTFPELITNEIVGVQPMSGPVGLAFALRYKYATTSLDGTEVGGQAVGSGVAGNPGTLATAKGGQGTNELGHNHLATGFTGTVNTSLSTDLTVAGLADDDGVGDDHWLEGGLSANDAGFAAALSAFEMDKTADNMPTVELSFEKTAVEAGTRRLGARWSVELEQDLKNMNGIDVDAELTNAMSYEIQAEIDREMIIRMVQSAVKAGSGTGFSTYRVSGADARWMAERNRDFYQKLIVEANRMAVRNRRGAANFIVATPRICAILEMLPEFSWMTVDGNVNTQPVGVAKVGNVGGRFNVYRDTRTEAQYNLGATAENNKVEYALLGYKGPEYYDTGIIYCPYIPVMVQRSIDPNSFYPKVGMLTRYGVVDHLFGASNYYHVVFVLGLGTAVGSGAAAYTPFQ
ncbi:MAG TPA: hypothetical protein DF712_13370 [Balneola sp.]|nr:hypothetical protein [Balneola sp.]|tara:strand:- start:840 stop:2375 length:1536 start_codon:yes stop_codon:yes gene_type:complete